MSARFALRLRPLARSVEHLEQPAPRPFLTRAALVERAPGDTLRNMAAVLADRLEADGSCLLDDLVAAGYSADEVAALGDEALRIAHIVTSCPRPVPSKVTFTTPDTARAAGDRAVALFRRVVASLPRDDADEVRS